jgi:hypothetical protein
MKQIFAFAGLSLLLIVGLAWLLAQLWPDPAAQQAVWFSAGIALGIQILGFLFVRVIVPAHVIAGWGAGMLLRFLTLVLHALIGVRLMGFPPAPALLSLAAFFFVSTLIEPVFLKKP